jgi:hypothetical protein
VIRVYKEYKSQGYTLALSRDGGIRTHDLQHPMLARYRATLHPENRGQQIYKTLQTFKKHCARFIFGRGIQINENKLYLNITKSENER